MQYTAFNKKRGYEKPDFHQAVLKIFPDCNQNIVQAVDIEKYQYASDYRENEVDYQENDEEREDFPHSSAEFIAACFIFYCHVSPLSGIVADGMLCCKAQEKSG